MGRTETSARKGGPSKRQPAAGRPSSSQRSAPKGKKRVPASTGRDSKPKGEKKAVSKRKSTVRSRECPKWVSWVATALFVVLVIYLIDVVMIRPYSYRWKPCHGLKAYDVCLPSGYDVIGIDVSHHQGIIDWEKVASSVQEYPIRFAFIKATEGGNFKDEYYERNIAGARAAGLACGSYLFYNPRTSPSLQADFFIRNVSLEPGDLPPVVDVERHSDSHSSLQNELLDCLRILENHYGVRPVIYASTKFRHRYLNAPEFDEYQFWVAHYYVEHPEEEAAWTVWQFTDRGEVDGIGCRTDMNVFYGSTVRFEEMRVRPGVSGVTQQ